MDKKINAMKSILVLESKNLIIDEKETVNYRVCGEYLDNIIEMVHREKENYAILNYAIKILDKMNLTKNARSYRSKLIVHLALIFPYIVPLLEDYIFKYEDEIFIKIVSNKIYNTYEKKGVFSTPF